MYLLILELIYITIILRKKIDILIFRFYYYDYTHSVRVPNVVGHDALFSFSSRSPTAGVMVLRVSGGTVAGKTEESPLFLPIYGLGVVRGLTCSSGLF